jgi:hypothetical protein
MTHVREGGRARRLRREEAEARDLLTKPENRRQARLARHAANASGPEVSELEKAAPRNPEVVAVTTKAKGRRKVRRGTV